MPQEGDFRASVRWPKTNAPTVVSPGKACGINRSGQVYSPCLLIQALIRHKYMPTRLAGKFPRVSGNFPEFLSSLGVFLCFAF